MTGAGPSAEDRSRALLEAGLTLASELDLDQVLRRIVELAMEITNARYGALGVLGDDRRIETFLTVGVDDETRARIGDPPTGHGILGLLIDEARPIRLHDIQRDPRSYGFPANHPPMHTFLGAPVRALGRVFGNIYLTQKQGADDFSEDDEEAVVVLAAQAGVAIENARLYAEMQHAQRELRRLEVLEDRERIAKELHDGVIQSLFAVGMGLQGTAAMAKDPELSRRIEHAVEEVDRAIRDLRNYIFGLRPGILADRELDKALRELAAQFEARTSVVTVVNVDVTVAAELASVASDVVQLTREALSNVGKHARASTCSVTLSRRDGVAELVIDDDGAGFTADEAHPGMGLANLRDRTEGMGGALSLESVAGEGTTVRVMLPLL
ncbi:MAG TPA: GAF domain-containing sensor histidine kinase [Actinomycetota bacterium]|nr:GAF domain-containing sensor histidine kinase [Actinomycetota bacterium]